MMPIGPVALVPSLNPTLRWVAAAAEDPSRRLPRHLPGELEFKAWAGLLHAMQSGALPESQLGASLLLGPEGLEIATEMAWRSRYPAVIDGKRFVGTVHVHPRGGAGSFDAGDLAAFLRSDYPGFLDLLVAETGTSAVVRTRRFLYISADRVDRDPLLLRETHPGFRGASSERRAPPEQAAAEADAAVRAVCHLYELALYRGQIDATLRMEYRPR